MRLDRFLCEMNMGTRSQVKDFIRQGFITVNDIPQKDAALKINENLDRVCFRGQPVAYCKYVYYMLNKPEGVVSATKDNTAHTVVSLLGENGRRDIFPVGRLDKDTTGLLLLTNDGELAHNLLSPKKHVNKTYRVTVAHPLSEEDIRRLEHGLDIGDEKPTLPSGVSVLGENIILLTIHEGRFHQVKRMLQAVNNQVTALSRIAFGDLELDKDLKPGEYRALTADEINCLKKYDAGR